MPNWHWAQTLEDAARVKVFSGGACNIRDSSGALLRNSERDTVNDWLTRRSVLFYDPQIHPDTHGCEYEYEVHHRLEQAARSASQITLFEVSPHTFCGVTSIEIAVEVFSLEKPTIIFFSDGHEDRDLMPIHSKDGYPLFAPRGLNDSPEAMRAHLDEMVKNANRMRQYLMLFAEKLGALTISFSDRAYEGDIVIRSDHMDAARLFEAVVHSANGKRTNVNFIGGEETRDERGVPRMKLPDNLREMQLRAYLDQYVDEGNELRRAICKLVHINVFMRVVFTQEATIHALDNLLRYRNL